MATGLIEIIELLEKLEYAEEYGSDEEITKDKVSEFISEGMYFDFFESTYNYLTQTMLDKNSALDIVQKQYNSVHHLILKYVSGLKISAFYDLELFRRRLERRGYYLEPYNESNFNVAKVMGNEKVGIKENIRNSKIELEQQTSFNYQGSVSLYDFFHILLSRLRNDNKIQDTTKPTFRAAFSGKKIKEIKNKINWTGTVPELKYFIKAMIDCNKISKVNNISQITASLFTIRGQGILPEQLNSNSASPDTSYKVWINNLMSDT